MGENLAHFTDDSFAEDLLAADITPFLTMEGHRLGPLMGHRIHDFFSNDVTTGHSKVRDTFFVCYEVAYWTLQSLIFDPPQ